MAKCKAWENTVRLDNPYLMYMASMGTLVLYGQHFGQHGLNELAKNMERNRGKS
jgi:hypothetical protein